MNNTAEFDFLRREVAAKYGVDVRTSKEFECLSAAIEKQTGQLVSVSTLKRFWGYMSLKPAPRQTTLDILTRYIGRPSFRDLCRELQRGSSFLSVEAVRSTDIKPDGGVELQWLPDRVVRLKHTSGIKFIVEDAGSSKLRQGDEFEVLEFIKGHPLYIPGIIRDGQRLPEYVAGRTAGLTAISIY